MKNYPYPLSILFVLFLLFIGCAAHTSLHPAGEGNWQSTVSLGGPIVNVFDTYLPSPWPTIGATYGYKDNLDFEGGVHLLPFVYEMSGVDLGTTWYPRAGKKNDPSIALQAKVMTLASFKEGVDDRFRFVPVLTGAASWRHKKNTVYYTGMNVIIPTTRPDYDDNAAYFLASPFAGYGWKLNERLKLFTELKWQGANIKSDMLAVTYTGIFGYGALAPLVAIEWNF
ncbi:hypothetical protein ACFLQJ_00265 [Calditrichota bacterium]